MKLLSSIAISFSLYSKIPMPVFEWDDENYRHAISFLPLIGAVISVFSYGVILLGKSYGIPVFVMTLVLTLLPLTITGGFHVDGFMDVQDALHSYQPKEKKLEIMKDPHIGAFSVIGFAMLSLLWLAALYMLVDEAFNHGNTEILIIYCAFFPFVRAFCGVSSIVLQNAKKDGMLSTETGKTGALDIGILSFQGILALAVMMVIDLLAGVFLLASMIIFTLWYKKMCDKQFGGVTGDTAGFFVVAGEAFLTLVLAALSTFAF